MFQRHRYRLLLLSTEDKKFYMDYTGCGNSLNMRPPCPAADHGFPALLDSGDACRWLPFRSGGNAGPELHDVDKLSAFFDIIQQDPVINQVKLIAEPWDVGEGGYQVGNFPPVWTQWNGKFRDCIRDFVKGKWCLAGICLPLYRQLRSLSELLAPAFASINFITAHDGFTLRDLVSYNGNTIRPMAKTTRMVRRITAPGTVASKGRPTIRRYSSCVDARCAIF